MTRTPRLLHSRDVEWEVVDSSNVHSALYDFQTLEFYVRFLRSGPDDIYRYHMTTPEEWADFMAADSKGGWIWDNAIDGNWPFDLLTQRAFWRAEVESVHPDVRRFALRRGRP